MNILVTGGSGFIGSHIVDLLLAAGHRVIIYDLESPKVPGKYDFVKGDVLDQQRLEVKSKGVDALYHVAAEANVNRFYESPYYSNLVTSASVLAVCEAAKRNNVSRVILASTEWVYGSREGSAQPAITEEEPYPQEPDHLYTSSKIAGEMFIKNYRRLFGLNFTIARYGIPFGERARAETVTPMFMRRILRGEEITVHGDGRQARQFIYVKDLAAGNVACLSQNAVNEIFNINGKEMISVLDIVKTLEEILQKKANVRFVEDRPGNFSGRVISSEKARRLLGWEPRVSYRDAMRSYVDWFLKNEQW